MAHDHPAALSLPPTISQYFVGCMMPDPPNPVQRALTIIDLGSDTGASLLSAKDRKLGAGKKAFLGEFSSPFSDPSRRWVNKPRKRGMNP